MKIEIIKSIKGELSYCSLSEEEKINNISDFFDVIMNCPTNTIIINKTSITSDFFVLKTGLAGDCLQKISNYRKRLVIIGDFMNIESKSLIDFIYESNKYGQVVFTNDVPNAIVLLR